MLLSIAARVAVASRGQSLPLARQHRPPQSALSQRVSASNSDLGGAGSVPQNARLVTPAIRAVCARRGLREDRLRRAPSSSLSEPALSATPALHRSIRARISLSHAAKLRARAAINSLNCLRRARPSFASPASCARDVSSSAGVGASSGWLA